MDIYLLIKIEQQIIAQKEKYAASVGSINFKFPLKSFKQGFFQGNTDTM